MKRFLLATLFALAGFQVNAAVIDFNSLTGSGDVYRGQSYQEDGFQLDTTGNFYSLHSGLGYDGTPSFFNNTVNGVTTLKNISNAVFSLDSIDLDSLNGGYTVTVTFIGTLLNGSTTTTSFQTNDTAGMQTFTFGSSFDNVRSVAWTQASPYHSFDNIVVNAAQVPEPGTMAMLGLGLLAFTTARRKSAKK